MTFKAENWVRKGRMEQEKFFEQSYLDALRDYVYSCKEGKGEKWDWIILTAASEKQAEIYRLQVKKRKEEKWLPAGTRIAVIADYKNERTGSGGATLNVLRYIGMQDGFDSLLNKKILVIHSGGDSRRIPQYSACGKLFAPVPRILPGGSISSIFDELLILASGIPGRTGQGMMIFPSDTEMLLSTLQLDILTCDAAGLSIKAPVTEGKEHGVFLQGNVESGDGNRYITKFLHKLSEEELRKAGAADDRDQVDIDTGCIWLGRNVLAALISLITVHGKFDRTQFEKYVNPRACLNFYADFVYPLSDCGTLEEFLGQAPENGISQELLSCRRSIWEKLHGFRLSLIKMAPARYIHFGMTHELFDLFVNDIDGYVYLGWEKRIHTNAESGTVLNSCVSAKARLAERVFAEDSFIGNGVTVCDGAVLSNIEAEDCLIPDDTVLSGIRLENGKYVCRIYGREDNPKASGSAPFLGGSIENLAKKAGVLKSEIWRDRPASIWNAMIYPEKNTMKEAVKSALSIHRILHGGAGEDDVADWKASRKHSMESSFLQADSLWLLDWRDKMKHSAKMDVFQNAVAAGFEAGSAAECLCRGSSSQEIEKYAEMILLRAGRENFPDNMRLYLAASDIYKRHVMDSLLKANECENQAYEVIKKCVLEETCKRFRMDWHTVSIKAERVEAELPVRINFCGSPSDAAPYCLEHGGTMLDGALLLEGKRPVRAAAEKIESGIIFRSTDQKECMNITDIRDIQDCGNPMDPFALHKAAVIAAGIVPYCEETSMEEYCQSIGGGIRITTDVDVPKGSGLGTSSILAAAVIKAVLGIFGDNPSDEEIYARVFLAEQLMNTGGGWQDQAGGFTDGMKYITSEPGKYQKIAVEKLDIRKEIMDELNSRFVLVFSGQRRLARNVLREEMNQCIRNDRTALEAIKKIQEYCAVMRHYLLKGEIREFAEYVTRQFELVKLLDKGASNTCIEYIFDVIDDLADGKSVCGAGGGGFLQVILKEGVCVKQLEKRIEEKFAGCGVKVWESRLI